MMMYRFKYGNRRTYADFFVDVMQKQYGDWMERTGVEAVIPVPMYHKKEKRRGYNQAGVLAKKIAADAKAKVLFAVSIIGSSLHAIYSASLLFLSYIAAHASNKNFSL